MRRREFLGVVGGAAAWPLGAGAQQRTMPVIGFLLSSATDSKYVREITPGFRRGLAETGFAEGRNVRIELRGADDRYERLPALAADLIQLQVAVIVASGAVNAPLAAK